MENNKLDTISNLFEGKEIRSIWDSEKGDYYFSVTDIISALTDSKIPKRYWTDLKRKLNEEGSQLYENIVQLKMKAKDGKFRETDTLDTKGILRLIESVPSPKAEPFKLWLAQIGSDRIDEIFDPEIATRELAIEHRPYGLEENKKVAKMGGHAAKVARDDIEKNLGRTIISNKNSLNYKYINQETLDESKDKKDEKLKNKKEN